MTQFPQVSVSHRLQYPAGKVLPWISLCCCLSEFVVGQCPAGKFSAKGLLWKLFEGMVTACEDRAGLQSPASWLDSNLCDLG